MWEGGRAPTEGRNPCCGPRHVTIFVPPRSRNRAQATPDAAEAQAECERNLSQVSARRGPGAPSPLLLQVQRCSGPRSAVRSAAPSAERAPAARAERSQAEGWGTPKPRPAKRLTAPLAVEGRWSPKAVRWGAAGYDRLSPRKGLSLHGAEASATPRSTFQSWATAGPARPAVEYSGLPPESYCVMMLERDCVRGELECCGLKERTMRNLV
ncbi:hypothetical protein NDU88_006412 [Pleurodeles waltl]|uniref:Uncharacterized protein n=1 Tax=Pleurodeles waltl TaxID=8319 RepID=A0AAV7WFI7_PLEWA|nr:hypothetical protein NDU88_006412 [Pleurodeles waltl]